MSCFITRMVLPNRPSQDYTVPELLFGLCAPCRDRATHVAMTLPCRKNQSVASLDVGIWAAEFGDQMVGLGRKPAPLLWAPLWAPLWLPRPLRPERYLQEIPLLPGRARPCNRA